MTVQRSPARLLAAPVLLLDFDGPVCAIFAGLANVVVADRLRRVLADADIHMNELSKQTADPLAVLQFASTRVHGDVLGRIESALITAEVEAIASAKPTPSAREFIEAAAVSGRAIAIVSNNSHEAINAYLERHDLAAFIAAVVGRPRERPHLMKPNPFALNEAMRRLSCTPSDAVLVGDSEADLGAARASGVAFIGYADSADRLDRLDGADAFVRSMAELVQCL